MATSFTKKEIEKAGENLIWAQGIIDYVLRTGANLKESESISIFSVLSMLLNDATNIFDPLTIETVFSRVETNKSNGDES
jgi:hypothetical protein